MGGKRVPGAAPRRARYCSSSEGSGTDSGLLSIACIFIGLIISIRLFVGRVLLGGVGPPLRYNRRRAPLPAPAASAGPGIWPDRRACARAAQAAGRPALPAPDPLGLRRPTASGRH